MGAAARRFACAEEARELLRRGPPGGGHWGFACGGCREGLRRTVKSRGASSGTSAFRYVAPLVPFFSFGSHPPVVVHLDGGPSETNGRQLIALIYSDGRGPPAIRRDYWDAMCDKWATEDFRHRSRIAAENRTKMPEATLHTSGSISFGRQKRKMEKEKGGLVSYKELFEHTHRKKIQETYAEQMVDKHDDDSTQHPEFDAMAWLAATGQPKKGRVFGFGSGLDAG
ncbi:hypothetical protein Taro_047607 [Colocasia esculenta]|uniref:Uncharacterized protein n=1 Tax=Colocasia esculenta TaxID=4460 RepID=A0A843X5L9_COLES|nr:hypothetical protein [Colocasia esculenta]